MSEFLYNVNIWKAFKKYSNPNAIKEEMDK